MDNYIGRLASYVVEPVSRPYACFRNKDALVLTPVCSKFLKKRDVHDSIQKSVLYYQQKLQDCPIDTNTLYSCLSDDVRLLIGRFDEQRHNLTNGNSLLGLHHEDTDLLVHTAGACFDRLVLRSSSDILRCRPSSQPGACTAGFTLQLDSEIVQLEKFGTSSWNTSVEFLAITGSEVHHIKTARLTEHVGRLFSPDSEPSHRTEIMLEPVQKWIPNFQSVSVSGSKSTWSHAFLLSAQEELFSLSCEQGVQAEGCTGQRRQGVSIFDGKDILHHSPPWTKMSVESTAHSQVCLLSRGQCVYRKDLREGGVATALFQVGVKSVAALHCLVPAQSAAAASYSDPFLVAIEEGLLLMDPRFPRECIAQRAVPGGHSMIRGSLSTDDLMCGAGDSEENSSLIVSAGAKSRQVSIHSMCSAAPRRSSGWAADRAALLSASSVSGPESSVSWSSTGFPVIDTDVNCYLRGLELMYLAGGRAGGGAKGTMDGVAVGGEPDDTDGSSKEGSDARRGSPLLLFHQSRTGDVYAQEVSVLPRGAGVYRAPLQTNLPVGVRCSADNVDASTGHEYQQDVSVHGAADSYYGLNLGDTLFPEDRDCRQYPLPSTAFVPAVNEADLKRFNVLSIHVDSLLENEEDASLSDGRVRVVKSAVIEDSRDLQILVRENAADIKQCIQSQHSVTLWELWRFIADKVQTEYSVEDLRCVLDSEMAAGECLADVEAFLIHIPERRLRGNTGDGLQVKRPAVAGISAEEEDTFAGDYLSELTACDCHSVVAKQFATGSSSAQRGSSAPARDSLWACRAYTLARRHLSTCGRQTCLLVHAIVYKLKNHRFGPAERGYLPEESSRKHSDVTTDVMLALQDLWGEREGTDDW